MGSPTESRSRSMRHRLGVRRVLAGVACLTAGACLVLPATAGAATSGATASPASAASSTLGQGAASTSALLQNLQVAVESLLFDVEEVVTCFNPCIIR